jgi:hypothetical protein
MYLRSVNQTLSAGANTLKWEVGNQEDLLLLGVNLEETDTSDNPQPDSGSIFVQDPSEANSISLAHGGMVNGQLSAFGCLPLNRGQEIIAKLWHARANYNGKFNVYLAERSQFPQLQLAFNWFQRQSPSPNFTYGKLKVGSVVGSVGVTPQNLRPDDGYIWRIVEATGENDEGGLTCYWQFTDGTTTVLGPGTSPAANNPSGINAYDSNLDMPRFAWPVYISYDVYLQFAAIGLGGAKKITIKYVVEEFAE